MWKYTRDARRGSSKTFQLLGRKHTRMEMCSVFTVRLCELQELWSEWIERKPALREMAKREEGGRKNECFPDRCINERTHSPSEAPVSLQKKKKKKERSSALASRLNNSAPQLDMCMNRMHGRVFFCHFSHHTAF